MNYLTEEQIAEIALEFAYKDFFSIADINNFYNKKFSRDLDIAVLKEIIDAIKVETAKKIKDDLHNLLEKSIGQRYAGSIEKDMDSISNFLHTLLPKKGIQAEDILPSRQVLDDNGCVIELYFYITIRDYNCHDDYFEIKFYKDIDGIAVDIELLQDLPDERWPSSAIERLKLVIKNILR